MERQTPGHVNPVTTPASYRRSGFTLVELLAVIMIIALLAALVTPAVMKSLSSSRAAAVKAEIELLNTALMNYKNEYGSFPPSDMRGLWNGSSANTSHPAYKHLQRIFPRIIEPTSGGVASPYFWMAQMSPAQALVFWLQGFFDDPQHPLTNGETLSAARPRAGTASANRKELFDFDESRLYAAAGGATVSGVPTFGYWNVTGPFGPPQPQAFATRNSAPGEFARDYPVYFPNQANTSLPYVYFLSSSYSTWPTAGASQDLLYFANGISGDSSAIGPYFDSAKCATLIAPPNQQYSWTQLHLNPDTFQIISAGADGRYADSSFPVAGFPNAVTFSYQSLPNPPGTPVSFGYGSVKDTAGHEDNITNFAIGRLKEAAERLSQ